MPARHLTAPAHSRLPAQRRTTQFQSTEESYEARPDLETCQSQDCKDPIFSSWRPRPGKGGKGDCHGRLNLETWATANTITKDKREGGAWEESVFNPLGQPPAPLFSILSRGRKRE